MQIVCQLNANEVKFLYFGFKFSGEVLGLVGFGYLSSWRGSLGLQIRSEGCISLWVQD
jgi:hypothetical protein